MNGKPPVLALNKIKEIVLLWVLVLQCAWQTHPLLHKYELSGEAQGTTYHIIYFTAGVPVIKDSINDLLEHMEACFSLYREQSLIQEFNRSTRGIRINAEFREVIQQCVAVFQETKGLADPTVFPLVKYWSTFSGQQKPNAPQKYLATLRSCVGFRGIYLMGDSLIKNNPCLQLDLNGTAQGFSVDYLANYLERHQISDYLVELGGEIRVRGRKYPGGEKYKVAVELPLAEVSPSEARSATLYLDQGAVTTSGNYRKYLESGGKLQSHIINPLTGYPVVNELISVTVYAETALIADAYDNALMAMGLEQGMQFVEAHPWLAAHFVYRNTKGDIAETSSSRMRRFWNP